LDSLLEKGQAVQQRLVYFIWRMGNFEAEKKKNFDLRSSLFAICFSS